MRKLLLTGTYVLVANLMFCQQKEGKVIYERTIQMQIQVNDNDAVSQMLPKTRTDKFELKFSNNESLWQRIDEEDNNEDMEGGGVRIRMMTPGQNDIVFCDFSNAHKVEQREMFDKNFIVDDSIHKLNWKLTGESETILGHVCQKAIGERIGKRMQMNLDNGKMERKEVTDTSTIVAWFTMDIPVPAGPEVQGQLPGLILALDLNNGRMTYKAVELSAKVDVASIKQPTKGKKVTPSQFEEERNKMMDEMQKNQTNGPNRIIIRD